MPKGSSGAKRLPNYKNAVVPRDKVHKYYLKPSAKHFDDFAEVGYTTKHHARLEADLKKGLRSNPATLKGIDEYGSMRYEVPMELGVAEKRWFLTGWQLPKGSSIPINTTAYRRDKK